jgi:hypothetical protein
LWLFSEEVPPRNGTNCVVFYSPNAREARVLFF